ncbi:MAG: YhdT family protein [Firmicutes bacterium]|nr:YhdT family protein [Bacillota bacterium]
MENKPEFVEDPRFHVCFREMIISYIFFFAFFVLVMLATYTLGNHFVLGLPLWFLVAGIILPVVFIIIAYILTEYVFEDTPLDPYLE